MGEMMSLMRSELVWYALILREPCAFPNGFSSLCAWCVFGRVQSRVVDALEDNRAAELW